MRDFRFALLLATLAGLEFGCVVALVTGLDVPHGLAVIVFCALGAAASIQAIMSALVAAMLRYGDVARREAGW